MIVRKFSPDLFVSTENRTTTRIVSRNVPFQKQPKTSASRLATEVGLLRPHNQIINLASRTNENSERFFESLTRTRRRNRNQIKQAGGGKKSDRTSANTNHKKIISITSSSANLNRLSIFQQLLDSNQCQQVATSRRDEFELCSQNKAPPSIITGLKNSFATDSYYANFTSSSEIRFLGGIKEEREKGGEIKRIVQASPDPFKRSGSKEQMNHYADIERSSKILSNATPASDASSIELRDDNPQDQVLSGAIWLEKKREEEEEGGKDRLSTVAQLLHYCSFKRNNQQQHDQQPSYHFRRKHNVSEEIGKVCSKRHTIGHQRRNRLMMKAPDFCCYSKKASLWRLLTSPLILLMCLVVLSIRTNPNDYIENSGSSFFSHRDNIFLSLGLVEALSSPKSGSFSLINSRPINPEKNHQKIVHIQETRHELSRILKRVGRQRDYDDSPKSYPSSSSSSSSFPLSSISPLDSRYNNSDIDNEHEAVLSSSDYDSTYNNIGNTNDSSDDSKLQRNNYNNSSLSSSNKAPEHNTADSSEKGSVLNAIDGENGIKAVLDRTASNQSSATIFGNRFENSNLSSTLIGSLFSHIDKQWNFAEVILIIVISAILNLVTIIGNIMVLISFKMDRS